ncbi:hypothetical protein QQ045_004635 [Rhodiola kirilowii]
MELPECNTTHWKIKFIDRLLSLFAERIRRILRQNYNYIPYENYTYGKLIGVCTQEGIALCNEIRLNQQMKRQNLIEKQQLGQFCDHFANDKPSSSKPRKPVKDYKPYHRKKRYTKRKYKIKSGGKTLGKKRNEKRID